MKFKLFPELTDILLCERYETSGGYWHKHKLERAVDSLKIHPTSYQIPPTLKKLKVATLAVSL